MESVRKMQAPLSDRGQHSYDFVNNMSSWNKKCMNNSYDPLNNPKGIIDLGRAENTLCGDIISEKMNEPEFIKYDSTMQFYFDSKGVKSFREDIAKFMTIKFKAPQPLHHDNIILTSGAGAAIDLVVHAFTDPGDCFLCLAPYYGVVKSDLASRGKINIYEIQLSQEPKDCDSYPFQIHREILEENYQKAVKQGEKVKGLLILNPDNPTGNVCSKKTVQDIVQFAASHDLHVIWDEVYGLSVFDKDTQFHSILAEENLPQPERMHVVWGFSKDFGLSGFRCGVLHSWHKVLPHCLRHVVYFGCVPSLVQHKLHLLIKDEEWLEKVYFPTNLSRMREAYDYCFKRLRALGAQVHPSKASYFVWADVSKFMKTHTEDEETRMFESLFNGGVYITPARSLYYKQPGWIRIVFTHPLPVVKEGLDRLERMLSQQTWIH